MFNPLISCTVIETQARSFAACRHSLNLTDALYNFTPCSVKALLKEGAAHSI